jgi:ferritin
MLSQSMQDQLNAQIALEYVSSNLYLQMSAWCEHHNFENAAAFLRTHAVEERNHMEKLYNYVLDTGGYPILSEIPAPKSEYSSLKEVFEDTLEHEKHITAKINELVDHALTTKDFSTFNFLQWYVQEQHEEEKLFNTVLGKFELIGDDTKSVYFIDKEIAKIAAKKEGQA